MSPRKKRGGEACIWDLCLRLECAGMTQHPCTLGPEEGSKPLLGKTLRSCEETTLLLQRTLPTPVKLVTLITQL